MRVRIRLSIGCLLAMVLLAGCGDSPTSPSAAFDLTLAPTTVAAGGTIQGTVTLRSRTAHDYYVQLSSSDGVASVPASIVVPAGSASAAFTVTTRLVAADTVAKITAVAGETRQDASLQVLSPVAKPPTLDALELDTTVVRGGQSVQGTVRLTAAAPVPGGLTVSIRTSNAAAIVPATVTVSGGTVTSTFTLSTRPVTLDTQLEITATYIDQIRTVPLRVTP